MFLKIFLKFFFTKYKHHHLPITLKFSLKPLLLISSSDQPYDPLATAERQLLELLQCDNVKTVSKSASSRSSVERLSIRSKPVTKTTKTIKNINNNPIKPTKKPIKKNQNALKNQQFRDSFEALENLINDNFTTEKERKYSDDITSIDPILINEKDDLVIPIGLLPSDETPPTDGDGDVYSLRYDQTMSDTEKRLDAEMDLERLMSVLEGGGGAEVDVIGICSNVLNSSMEAISSGDGKKKTMPIKRSISLTNPVVKARSMKNRQDIQDFLHAKSPNTSDFPDVYEDYKRYEAALDDNVDGDSSEEAVPPDTSPSPPPPVVQKPGKLSGDSAYGR